MLFWANVHYLPPVGAFVSVSVWVHVSDIKAPERSGCRVHQSSAQANVNAFPKSLQRAVCVIQEDKDFESCRINKCFLQQQQVNSNVLKMWPDLLSI